MEKWLEVLGIIELIVGLLVLVFLGYVTFVVVKYRHNEFNKYWRTRTLICGSAVVWVVFLLLGNEYLWNSSDGIFNINSKYSNAICALHVFFTVGSSEPLFFLIFLFIIKSKTSDKNHTLYIKDPNKYVYTRALIWTIPLVVIHIVILILDASSISEPRKLFWTVYDKEGAKCAVPIISTAAFAIFFVIFLFFFIILSRNFIKSVINRLLINRLRLLQFAFIAFLPLEVAIRVVLIFTLNLGNTSIALFHAFFFVDIAVVIIAVLEFSYFPISDELGFYFINFKSYKLLNSSGSGNTKDGSGAYANDDINDSDIMVSTNSPMMNDSLIGKSSNSTLIPISEYEKTVKNSSKQLFNPFKSQYDDNGATTITIDEFDDDVVVGGGGGGGRNNTKEIEMDKLSKLSKLSKSPVLDRVRDTEPTQVPPLPLSSPLSSSPSSTSPNSLSPNSNHERKKSRRFSFSKRKSQSIPTSSSSSPSSSLSNSPPPPSQSTRTVQYVNPVEDFKEKMAKYSQNKRF